MNPKTFWTSLAMAADGGGDIPAADPAVAAANPPPAPPAPIADGKPTTIADGQPPAEAPPAPPADTPKADWPTIRAALAADDPEFAKELERTGDGKAFAKRFMDGVKAIRSGTLISKEPPKDATPEQMSVWRKAQGVPDKPDDYETPLPAGYKATPEVGERLDAFRKLAHEQNIPAGIVKSLTEWNFAQEQAVVQARADADKEFQATNNDDLLKTWGTDYGSNLAAIKNVFGANEDMWHEVMGARGPDGNVLGNNAKFLSFLLDIGVQANPTLRQFAGDGRMTESNVVGELKELAAKVKKGDPAYWKDEKAQARFSELTNFAAARNIDWQS